MGNHATFAWHIGFDELTPHIPICFEYAGEKS